MLLARKIGAALAAGCTTVSKPASGTPLTTAAWFACFDEAGFPPGAVNLVTGPASELAEEFLTHPDIAKLAFTGSTEVGRQLLAGSAAHFKKLELELGGHAPVLVFPDVDLSAAVEACVVGKFRNMGQSCISLSRFYVHRDIAADFTEAVVARVAAMKLGHPLDPECEAGPLFEARGVEKTEGFVADLLAKGGRVLLGGRRPPGFDRGYWYEPTVADRLSPDMRLCREEIFGPLMPLFTFDDLDSGLRAANDTPYGLAAYVLTRDLSTALRCAEELEAGVIGINDGVPSTAEAPFGGMKHSGLGRENGMEGLGEYLETKFVSLGPD
jgi:succinate-semialdehyde dehydrogenase/glutarate-semialdehyde dehydrogenase